MEQLIYGIVILSGICYFALFCIYNRSFHQHVVLKKSERRNLISNSVFVSVIIVARNEENNIVSCIQSVLAQKYPAQFFEIIVVDDHSTDQTLSLLNQFTDQNIQVLQLKDYPKFSPEILAFKKMALSYGILNAKGTLILTTDADCIVPKYWLENMVAVYEKEQSAALIAPVNYTTNGSLLSVFQSIDFAFMQGITAATNRLNWGTMGNGANLGFTKEAYLKVGGYEDNLQLSSGDDFLLLHKINKEFSQKIDLCFTFESTVSTEPQPSWRAFINQRIRWASKSGKYDDWKLTATLMFVYFYNVLIFFSLICAFFYTSLFFIILLSFKLIAEIIFAWEVLGFFKKRNQIWGLILFQPLHIIYIILAGFLGLFKKYNWKDRIVK